MVVRLLLLALVSLVLFTSCAKPKYLIKGLTLPPGSTVVGDKESLSSREMGSLSPMGDHPGMKIVIAFNCSGDWNSVKAHFDDCLGKSGYNADDMSGSSDMPAVAGVSLDEMMRIYGSDGDKYGVMLNNLTWMKSIVPSGAGLPLDAGYIMTVIDMEAEYIIKTMK